jgi:hypothetical protein
MVNIKRLYKMNTNDHASGKQELKGGLTIKLKGDKTLDEFCRDNFENYDSERFEAVAIRMFYGKETIITLYALDKVRQQTSTYALNKIPVKKFKKGVIGLADLMTFVEEFNFTISSGHYPIEDMEVINK